LLLVNSVDWCASVKIANPTAVTGKRGGVWGGSGDPAHPFGSLDPNERWGGSLNCRRCGFGARPLEVQITDAHAGSPDAHRGRSCFYGRSER